VITHLGTLLAVLIYFWRDVWQSRGFVAGILAIAFLMNLLRRITFLPFVLYRMALGVFLLVLVYAYGAHLPPASKGSCGPGAGWHAIGSSRRRRNSSTQSGR
jgi:hypothetical protein